jgi:predicted DNA-binding protein
MSTKTTRVSALLPSSLVEEIRKFSENNNITQSYIIKNALESWLSFKLEKDTKILSKINFNDLPSENDWQSIQSAL